MIESDRKRLMSERITDLRKARKWNRVTAGNECCISARAYTDAELAVYWPNTKTLVRICAGLNATPNYLLGFDNE